ncbi:Zinc finger RING/FYVE/PHD-type protein [Dioscorea alata]|uniref:Zinc finger RING/FYVE/PHD-type protein n=1 Tax=Dioscorea alata TaxID=55571 RepID=A0ACB7WW92_DIOAL|nr:Zinc finger RING/FYVE/PHD-type protein [Dioscorea alata]
MSSLHHFLFKAFHLFGLSDLLLLDDLSSSSSSSSSCKVMTKSNIDEALPVVKYEQVMAQGTRITDGGCIVCLHEFHGDDEVRRLTNCRHVFHRCCLDGWLHLGRMTCPLCRSPLFSVAVPVPVAVDEPSFSFVSETNHLFHVHASNH